jgi:hypothetical protein
MAHEHGMCDGQRQFRRCQRAGQGAVPSAFMTLFMVRPLLPGLLLSRSLYPAPYTCARAVRVCVKSCCQATLHHRSTIMCQG